MRQRRRSYRERDDDEDAIGEDLAAVNDRLDELTRQLERMAQANATPRPAAPSAAPAAAEAHSPDRVADALARLDRRLDQVIQEGRAVTHDLDRRRHAPQPHHAPPAMPPLYYAPQPHQPAPVHHAPFHQAAPVHHAPAIHHGQPAQRPPHAAPPQHPPQPSTPPAPPQAHGLASWAAQISARQRMLDGVAPVPAAPSVPVIPAAPPAPAPAPAQPVWAPAPVPAPDYAGLEQQLRDLNSQISALHRPYEDALAALRSDLAEIGHALTEAMPRRAIETLEAEVRTLTERVDRSRQAGAEGAAFGNLEQELAEIRNALRNLTPAESLVGFEEAVRALSHKIDQIAGSAQIPHDPHAFRQLEQAVVSLRGVVSNVASDGALAQLAAEVRGLAAQFERAATDSSTEALSKLEARITALMESGRAVPADLEGSIRELSERLDRAHLSQGDHLALGALEDRITKLSEKLDASDARLGQLSAIERGLADLLVHLEEMKAANGRALRAPAAEPAPAAAAQPPLPETPSEIRPAPAQGIAQSPLDLIPDVMQPEPPKIAAPPLAPEPTPPQPAAASFAPPPAPMAPPPPAAEMAPQPEPRRRAKPIPRGPERQPIDPNLPPDTPLEPGSGVPRLKPGSAAARIAASEAALGSARPRPTETGGKSAAIAAARSAAKAAYLDTPVKAPKAPGRKTPRFAFKWPFKKTAKLPPAPQLEVFAPSPAPAVMPATALAAEAAPQTAEPIAAPVMAAAASSMPEMAADMLAADGVLDAPPSRRKRVLKVLKTLLVAASVCIIVLGTAQTILEFLFPPTPAVAPAGSRPSDPSGGSRMPPATVPSRPMPTPEGTLPAPPPSPPPSESDPTGALGSRSFFDPKTILAPRPTPTPAPTAAPAHEATGSIPKAAPAQTTTPVGAPVSLAPTDTLPQTMSHVLRTAALVNEPAATYEVGSRYADGRGVQQNMSEAVRWFERAADAGFAPAQFRLASLNEKGEGTKKDVQAARRLYIAAASQGHAKAMHNLAVLFAEGIDGRPDYKAAAEWFRKAATYGVTDSQYNLAVLYARGIGVQANMAESYRWFALAAVNGDQDAARKRDEVAARLDQQTLAAAKLSVQSFAPEHEPDAATNLKAPPGGWDHATAHPARSKRSSVASPAR